MEQSCSYVCLDALEVDWGILLTHLGGPQQGTVMRVWDYPFLFLYLLGYRFELITDHKPLLAHKSTSAQASTRIHRWSLFLATFEYTIRFRKTEAHRNADALRNLCTMVPDPAELILV